MSGNTESNNRLLKMSISVKLQKTLATETRQWGLHGSASDVVNLLVGRQPWMSKSGTEGKLGATQRHLQRKTIQVSKAS